MGNRVPRLLQRALVAALAPAMLWLLPIASADARAKEATPSVVASFEGGWIRLADGWGAATACTTDGASTRCYRTHQEMDAAEGEAFAPAGALSCSPSVSLYRSTGWTGGVLHITAHFVVTSLAPYGFNNDTSSYEVGSCNSNFYDTTTGGGSYPGNTAAGAQASSMAAGWNNRVSSVYIT